MAQHKNLTGANLHEPKGVDAAAIGTVYEADGAGSGSWVDPLRNLNNENLLIVTKVFSDISTGGSIYIPVPLACAVTKITIVTDSTFTGTNTITAQIVPSESTTGAAVTGISIACTGANANTVNSGTSSSNNSLSATDTLRIISDGLGTGSCSATVVVTLDVS